MNKLKDYIELGFTKELERPGDIKPLVRDVNVANLSITGEKLASQSVPDSALTNPKVSKEGDTMTGNLVIDNTATLIIDDSLPPASATAVGIAGEIRWDSSAVYICVSQNSWKKATISTW